MERVEYYVSPNFNAGYRDAVNREDLHETSEGFFVGIINVVEDGVAFPISKILLRKIPSGEVAIINPNQLIRFVLE